jgi:site-specific DNA-methyltransferase (adenine-specific)
MTRQRKMFASVGRFDFHPYCSNGELRPAFETDMGALFAGDCLNVLPLISADSIDTVFADPPFNLGKEYGSKVDDKRESREYVEWCYRWLAECIRVLKPGGTLFTYNIPKWSILLAHYMMEQGMHFRDWIVVDIKFGFPIAGRLYPSHYSLLYFTKGRHKTFHNIRTPIKTCRHCGGEVKDYGGHRGAMNPKGVNLADVWDDIPPVRHWKFKTKNRPANCLSTKILNRVIGMSTDKGDIVLDPFGGSGTTYAVCERMERRWIGIEMEKVDVIVERLTFDDLHHHPSTDLIED